MGTVHRALPPKGFNPSQLWRRIPRWARQLLEAAPFMLPVVVGLIAFNVGPVLASLGMSFTKWELGLSPEWIGVANYTKLLGQPRFWKVLRNTFYFTLLYVPAGVVLPLFVALLLNLRLRGISVYRTAFFVPVVTSMVAVAFCWALLYDPRYGPINYLLNQVGIRGPDWLNSTTWVLPAFALMSIWRVLGYNTVLYLAGLQSVPEEYYEAARIDGAGGLQQFIRITVPLITPTAFFVLVMMMIGSLQVFAQTFILTRGGPANASLTLSYWIYQNAFEWTHLGFGAALAWVLAFIIWLITRFQFAMQKRWVFYQ